MLLTLFRDIVMRAVLFAIFMTPANLVAIHLVDARIQRDPTLDRNRLIYLYLPVFVFPAVIVSQIVWDHWFRR